MPQLMEYITIPAISPAYDPKWHQKNRLLSTLELAQRFCQSMEIENSNVCILNKQGRTPILLMTINATDPDIDKTVFMFGHLDKQPPAEGWDQNKGPWTPVIENNRPYGRGSADDGYAVFSAVTAVKALQEKNIAHPKIVILIETCEESGSWDLEYYMNAQSKGIGNPDLIICLDSGCVDYERLWITASLRGSVDGKLETRILNQRIHSGNSGMVASSFRIIRQILDRIENSATGEVRLKEFHTPISEKRQVQITQASFNAAPCFTGEGGSIPFMTLLAEKFPDARFLITGVLGPKSNAHGPNEFLHLPYVKKLTLAVSYIIADF